MTVRRYEMGRPVFDNRANTPSLGGSKKDSESSAARPPMTNASSDDAHSASEAPRAHAKVVRRPPSIVATEPASVATLPVATEETKRPAAPMPPADDDRIEDTSDMRKFLLKQMGRAARGEITTETVKNIVTLAQQVYNATSLELKAATILKDSERSIRALELVSPQDAGQ